MPLCMPILCSPQLLPGGWHARYTVYSLILSALFQVIGSPAKRPLRRLRNVSISAAIDDPLFLCVTESLTVIEALVENKKEQIPY